MKNIFKLMALFAFLFCFSSCEDDEPVISTLEVTPANLEGTWKLAEWNGASLDEGTYCYVIFNVSDCSTTSCVFDFLLRCTPL